MTVITGEDGLLQIRRTATGDGTLTSILDAADVNVVARRFSFDFPANALISGDRAEIATTDGTALELVQGHNFPDGAWYVHVDEAGGVRLYDNFRDAINGGYSTALELVTPSVSKQIAVRTRDLRYNCISQMQSWELTTARQTVDTTSLGEEFISLFARGLVSGQGTLTCLWDYRKALCDPLNPGDEDDEVPHYLCQLLLRIGQGSKFDARFYAYVGRISVWYESACIVTNVGLSFAPGQPVVSRIEFVTTGPVELKTGQPDAYLLQENESLILVESGDGGLLLEDPLD